MRTAERRIVGTIAAVSTRTAAPEDLRRFQSPMACPPPCLVQPARY